MWTDATTTALFVEMMADVSVMLYVSLSAILVIAVGLVMVPFALRELYRHITGKPF